MPRIQLPLPEHVLFSTDVPIYIGHVNYGGHLDNAQLLALVSEARMRFFKWLGYAGELDIDGQSIVVADMAVQYKSEAFHGETLQIDMQATDFNKYGFDLVFRLQDKATGREIARGKTGVVFLAQGPDQTKRIAPPPASFMARLAAKTALIGQADVGQKQPT
jgi:acyl-CoA thioester hydrolase